MVEFAGNVVFMGFGAVAQCTLPIFVKHVRVPLKQSRSWISRTPAEA